MTRAFSFIAFAIVLTSCGTSSSVDPSSGLGFDPSPRSECLDSGNEPLDWCVINGNINSVREKAFYLPEDRGYELVEIDLDMDERWICFENDAVDNGWERIDN